MVTLENPVKHLSYIVKKKKAKVKLLVISNKERLKVFTFIAQHETPEEFANQLLLSLGDPSLAGSAVPYQWDTREDFPAIVLSQLLPWVKGLLFTHEHDTRLSLDAVALFLQNKSQAIYTYPTGQAHAPAKALKPSARQDVATLSFLDMAQAILDKKHNKASPKPSDAEKKKPSDGICERCRAEGRDRDLENCDLLKARGKILSKVAETDQLFNHKNVDPVGNTGEKPRNLAALKALINELNETSSETPAAEAISDKAATKAQSLRSSVLDQATVYAELVQEIDDVGERCKEAFKQWPGLTMTALVREVTAWMKFEMKNIVKQHLHDLS